MSDKKRTGNDQASDVKNPNNADHKAAQDNKTNQHNPNHSATKSGSKK